MSGDKFMARCEYKCDYCGIAYVRKHPRQNGMCWECGKVYENLMAHLNSINAIMGHYRMQAAAGHKVPVDIELYDKIMSGGN